MRLRVISLVMVLSAVSYAQSSTTISACFNTTNGQMRFVTSASACRGGENLVTWNAQGPKGDKGDTGDRGPKGDPGDPGPAGGGAVVYTTGRVVGEMVHDFQHYADLTLPEGSYMVDAVIDVHTNNGVFLECVVSAVHGASATFQEKTFGSPPPPAPSLDLDGVLVYHLEADGVTQAFIGCQGPAADGAFLSRVSLRAVSVAEIHEQ